MQVLVVGLNPAFQRTIVFDKLTVGKVNRYDNVIYSAGGKGTNVARVLRQLDTSALLLTFLGGYNGEMLREQLQREEIQFEAVTCENETRVCTTLMDSSSGVQTELVEEGKSVTADELERLVGIFERKLTKCKYVIISGTAPPKVPHDLYFRMILAANNQDKKVIVDTQGELLLKSLAAKPWIAKPNLEEIKAAFGATAPTSTAGELVKKMVELGARNAIISEGEKGIWVGGEFFGRVKPPRVRVLNAIGSGDAVSAGIAVADICGESFVDTLRFGVACGAANVLTPLAGHVRKSDVQRIFAKIVVEDA